MTRNLLNTINIDVPAAVADETVAFWSAALGAEPLQTKMPQYTILQHAAEPNRLVIQTVDDGPAGVHFDVHTDDLDAEVERLVASAPRSSSASGRTIPASWVVMRDPGGNEFCLVDGRNPLRGPRGPRRLRAPAPRRRRIPRTRRGNPRPVKPTTDDIVELTHLCATVRQPDDPGRHRPRHRAPHDARRHLQRVRRHYALEDWPALVAAAPKGLFLCGDPELELDGDTGHRPGAVALHRPDQPPHADGVVQRHLRPHRRTAGGSTRARRRSCAGAELDRLRQAPRPAPTQAASTS